MSSPSWTQLVGSRLDQYDIKAQLSTCGISRVYLAPDSASGREVTIKITVFDPGDHPHFVATSLRNWEAVRHLRHPNIVAVHDIGEGDGFAYLVTQYASGGTLRHLLREKSPLPVPDASCYMVQIAYALQYLHEQGIVHCGVKPANIFLERPGSSLALLADFGIARIPGAQAVTWSGSVIGTPCYMSPEGAMGHDSDGRSDIYSLGCVLYEALAGRLPFVGVSPISVLYQQVHARPTDIRDFNPAIPAELAQIVEKALAKRPDERFATAEAFGRALLPFAGKLPDLTN
jgi:eukaryotic-like serine/threonine-protein kinase